MTMEKLIGSLQAYKEEKNKNEDIEEQVLKVWFYSPREKHGRSIQRRGGDQEHGRSRGYEGGRGWMPNDDINQRG